MSASTSVANNRQWLWRNKSYQKIPLLRRCLGGAQSNTPAKEGGRPVNPLPGRIRIQVKKSQVWLIKTQIINTNLEGVTRILKPDQWKIWTEDWILNNEESNLLISLISNLKDIWRWVTGIVKLAHEAGPDSRLVQHRWIN
jgi:hypothetical protein